MSKRSTRCSFPNPRAVPRLPRCTRQPAPTPPPPQPPRRPSRVQLPHACVSPLLSPAQPVPEHDDGTDSTEYPHLQAFVIHRQQPPASRDACSDATRPITVETTSRPTDNQRLCFSP